MYASALVLAVLATGAVAQTTTSAPSGSAQTTLTALLGTATGGFAGSVVGADACGTTIALQCTDTAQCSAAVSLTITQGPSVYQASITTSTLGAEGTLFDSCILSGSNAAATQAVCSQSFGLSAQGTSTATSLTTTLTGTLLNYQPLAITAGAEKLASATGSCTVTPTTSSGAAPTAAPAAVLTDVYKVLVPVGAALLALA